jgi:hypothetical protein
MPTVVADKIRYLRFDESAGRPSRWWNSKAGPRALRPIRMLFSGY